MLSEQHWTQLWRRLTCPSPRLESEEQRHEARLLASMLFALLVASFVITPIWVLTAADFEAAPYIALAMTTTFALAYGLSRTRFYRLGVSILILTFLLIVLSTLLTSPGPLTERMLVLNFLTIAVMISSLFWPMRLRLLVVGVGIAIIGLFLFVPDVPFSYSYSYLVFFLVVSVLDGVSVLIGQNYRDRLAESEARYRSLFEDNQAVKLVIDPDTGRIVEANSAASAFYGYSHDQLLTMRIHDISTRNEADLRVDLQRASRGERSLFSVRHRLANGELRDVDIFAGVVNTKGKRYLHSIILDVTARKQAENLQAGFLADMRALQQLHLELSEIEDVDTLYQKMIELPRQRLNIDRMGLFVLNDTGDLLLGTYGVDELGAIRSERYYQEPITADHWTLDILHAPDHVRFWDHELLFDNAAVAGKGWKVSAALWNGQQVLGYLISDNLITHRPARPYEAELISILGSVFGHLIERKHAEEALRRGEARLKLTVQSTLTGTWEWNIPTGETVFNERWAEMIGYKLEELLPTTIQTWIDLAHPDDLQASNELLAKHFAGELAYYECEARMKHKDGHWVWVGDRGMVMEWTPEGRPLRMFGTHNDITDRKRSEALVRIQGDLALALSSTNNLTDTLNHVLAAVVQIEGIDCGGIYLVDQASGDLNLVTYKGLTPEFAALASHYEADDAYVGPVMTGTPFYRTVLPQAQDAVREGEGLRAIASIPVRFEEQIVAVLNLGSHTVSEIPLSARFALEEIASRVGAVVARVRVEAALRESEQNLLTLFETIDDFLFVADSSGAILRVNPVVLRRLDYSAEEILEKTLLDMHAPDRRDEAQQIVLSMLQGETSLCHVPLMTRSGTLIPVETRVTLGRWGGRTMIFGLSRDVTERQQNEKALRESEERHRALLNAIPDLIFRNARDGVYLDYYAQSTEDLFAFPEQFLGRTPADLFPPEEAARHIETIEMVLATGKEQSYEYSLPFGDGTRDFEARMVRAGPDEVLTIIRNVTERKRLQEKTLALAVEKERSAILNLFIQSASHELRTPLAVIKSNIYLLKNVAIEEKRQLYIDRVEQQANRLIRLLDMVLTMTKLDSETPFNYQPIDVNGIIQYIVFTVQGALAEKSVQLQFRPDTLSSGDLRGWCLAAYRPCPRR